MTAAPDATLSLITKGDGVSIFVVTARESKPDLASNIAQVFPNKYLQFADNVWFVRSNDTVKDVSEKLNVKKGGISGVVIMGATGSYFGLAASDVWDWLRSALEADADG